MEGLAADTAGLAVHVLGTGRCSLALGASVVALAVELRNVLCFVCQLPLLECLQLGSEESEMAVVCFVIIAFWLLGCAFLEGSQRMDGGFILCDY